MFDFTDDKPQRVVIKVIGVGGGGGNAVQHMINRKVAGVEFICANTDAQALGKMSGSMAVQLGTELTRGLGAGSDPEIGRQAALENKQQLTEVLKGTDLLFITAGLGGGTGTGAAPVVAEIAKELKILSVAVVTRPFSFEGRKRMRLAEEGARALEQHVDSLITIPNDRLLQTVGEKMQLRDAFAQVDDVLLGAVQGIADIITRPGDINVDFADVRTIMSETGMAMMGTGEAAGEGRANLATRQATSSPLLEDVDLSGASGILVNIASGENVSLGEFHEVGELVNDIADDNATVIVGTVMDASMEDRLRVTVVATGLGGTEAVKPLPESSPTPGAAQPATARPPGYGFTEALEKKRREQEQKGRTRRNHPDWLDIPSFLRDQAD